MVDIAKSAEQIYEAARGANYRGTFFASNPMLRKFDKQIVVHHRVPLEVLKKHPGLFTPEELNAVDNLRGIPSELNSTVHLSQIHRQHWDRFWTLNPQATRAQVLEFARVLDEKFNLQNLAYETLLKK